MGDLCDVALDAPEEKEEKRRGEKRGERGKIDADEHGRNNKDILHVFVQI